MSKATILLTGWEGISLDHPGDNPSGIIAHNLDGMEIEGHRVEGAIFSLDVKKNRQELSDLLRAKPRAACVSIGVMPTPFFRLETTRVNEIDTHLFPQYAIEGLNAVPLIEDGLESYTNATLNIERVEHLSRIRYVPICKTEGAGFIYRLISRLRVYIFFPQPAVYVLK